MQKENDGAVDDNNNSYLILHSTVIINKFEKVQKKFAQSYM